MILERPLRCSYFTNEVPDKFEGKTLTEEEKYVALAEGLIESERIAHNAVILRFDDTTITNTIDGSRQTFVTATMVDVDTGEMRSGYDINELVLEESSIKRLVIKSN